MLKFVDVNKNSCNKSQTLLSFGNIGDHSRSRIFSSEPLLDEERQSEWGDGGNGVNELEKLAALIIYACSL